MRIVSAGHDDELGTENFSLVDIRPEDIPEPNRAFVLFVRSTGNISGLNRFTIPQFAAQVRRRYTTGSAAGQ